ncbi:aminotransferase class V-fold PLP-dependent enzyme [uncultured Clostridium sp.]|jgi:selenocysteine lyase/cysteine desulfurase|uniref:aminotransferase class V-fold PLP-dependent enzyme n=1 Tax=uncultured Clostridium sp. TaxID=59620 RepID=UPI002604CEE6|nr:aminotransferase class V-fold PLP-dependent enzyme [uncultured Clostridium sp.]
MKDDNKGYRELFVGVDYEVKRSDGSKIIPINFDNAATTPPLKIVKENINAYMETYGSIGRGAGMKSLETTEVYEFSRDAVLDFFDLEESDNYTVIYVKNTTEGINLLADTLLDSKKDEVLCTRMEHHANDLPWRAKAEVLYLETDKDGKLIIDNLEELLRGNNIKVVTITGASNVTGYTNPVNRIAKLAHKYGAVIVVDAAQIVAHKYIDILGKADGEYLDFIVFSGHKMYAPFGSGVIVGKKDLIKDKRPFLRGGGAVNIVFDKEEYWGHVPHSYEAGTPNYFGVIGIISSMAKLKELGLDNIEAHENKMRDYLFNGVRRIPNIIEYGCAECENRLSLLSINLKNKDHATVAKELSYIREIAVRDGCFCAHSYVKRLLGLSDEETKKYLYDEELQRPGLVRISLGLYNDIYEIDEFLNSLEYIATNKIIY